MALTLDHAVPSRSMTVHWMLQELGEPFELRMVSIPNEEQKTANFRAINPMARVPVLTHDHVVVTETSAICAYLAAAFPDARLGIPAGDPDHGAYLRWLFFAQGTAEPAILWKALGKLTQSAPIQPFADVDTVAETLRAHLANHEYMAGDRFTAADVIIGATIMWGTQLMPVLPESDEFKEYWGRLEARPARQRAHQADMARMT